MRAIGAKWRPLPQCNEGTSEQCGCLVRKDIGSFQCLQGLPNFPGDLISIKNSGEFPLGDHVTIPKALCSGPPDYEPITKQD